MCSAWGLCSSTFCAQGGKASKPETTVAELGRHIQVEAHMENYDFVPRMPPISLCGGSLKRCVAKQADLRDFITENGKPSERVLGMLTPGTCWANPIDG